MKRSLIGLFAVLMTQAAFACPTIDVPDSYQIKEKVISMDTDFRLLGDEGDFGTIDQRVIRLSPSFVLKNDRNEIVAQAHQEIFRWGKNLEITDCNGARIGLVKEMVFRNFLSFSKRYEIYDASERLVATSVKKEFITTEFEIKSPAGVTAMTMRRGAINFLADTWNVSVSDDTVIDPRIAVMIPAFKTYADIVEDREGRERDRAEQEEKDRKRDPDRREDRRRDERRNERRN